MNYKGNQNLDDNLFKLKQIKIDMNTTGKKFGGRQKGTPNKLNNKIKDKLSNIINEAIDSIDLENMSKAETLKLIQLGIPYIMTKPQQEEAPQ